MGATMFQILFVVIVLVATCCGQCDPNGVNCISCNDYQQCSGGAPTGPILSCTNGVDCGDQSILEHCRTKLNCYALAECTESGIFPDPTVESNYFVCLPDSISGGFIKYDFSCPPGEYFDQTILMCLSSAATGETTLPPTTETTTPIPETTTPAPTTPPPFACTAPGIFPDPTNCKMYFRCSTSLTAFPYICPGRSYFNELTLKCSLIITPNCQEQILQNATVLTTVPTAAPEPVPPTAPTTPSTPTPTTPAPFACVAPGIFPNPNNCKMYFHCSTSLKAFYYICPGRSYFNEVIRKCSMIITPACQEQILNNSTTTVTPTTAPTTTPTTTPTTPTTTPTTPTTTPTTPTTTPTTPTTTPTTPTTTPTTPTTTPTTPTTTPTTPTTTPTTPTTTPTTPTTTPTTPTTTPTTPTTTPTTPTTTPTTPTTTPTTPTTTPTTAPTTPATEPPTPFSCPSAGTFEDPTNCKTYYRCSSTRTAFLYTCPGTSYFNEGTKRCGMAITPRCRSKLLA